MADTIPLVLDEEICEAVTTALDTGNYITAAYIGDDEWPHVSRRGTTQVLDEQRLAIWVRKRDDGLATAIAKRSQVKLFYIDLVQRRAVYTFYGTAHVSDDAAIVERAWDGSPERQKALDPDRKGVVVVVDLVRLAARGQRTFLMER
jgi:hypothetical protein